MAVGDEFEAGATLVVLESMKMETALRAPSAGRVREVFAIVNSQVDAGATLLRVDQVGEPIRRPKPRRESQFRTQPRSRDANPRTEALARLGELRALITGYDVSAGRARILLKEYDALRGSLPRDDQELVEAELGLLDTFADICELSRNRPTLDEEDTDERVHSPREHFHSFLHSLDAEVEGLPTAFRAKIARALRNYDVDDARARVRVGRSGLPAIPRVAAHGEPGTGDHRAARALAHRRRCRPPLRPVRWARYWSG